MFFKSSIKSLLCRSLLRSSSRKWVLTYSWAIRDNSLFSIAVLSVLCDQQLPPLCTLKIVPFLLPVTAVWFFGWLPWRTPHLNPASRCLWQSQAEIHPWIDLQFYFNHVPIIVYIFVLIYHSSWFCPVLVSESYFPSFPVLLGTITLPIKFSVIKEDLHCQYRHFFFIL